MFVITNTSKKFIPSSEKDNEVNPLTFIVQPPTKKVILDLQEAIFRSASDDEDINTNDLPLSMMINIYLDACVIGWENVYDAEGKKIPFTPENFEYFNDSTILIELYNFCRELTESNEKN